MFEGKYRPTHRAPLRIKTCGNCGDPGEFRRQASAYNDEASNWVYACDPCFDMLQDHWEEMWREYRAMVM